MKSGIKKYKINMMQDQLNDKILKNSFSKLKVYFFKFGLLR